MRNSMMALIIALVSTTPALADDSVPPNALLSNPEFREMMVEVGTYYSIAGQCSRYLSVEDFGNYIRDKAA